jgi:hypothetical protein
VATAGKSQSPPPCAPCCRYELKEPEPDQLRVQGDSPGGAVVFWPAARSEYTKRHHAPSTCATSPALRLVNSERRQPVNRASRGSQNATSPCPAKDRSQAVNTGQAKSLRSSEGSKGPPPSSPLDASFICENGSAHGRSSGISPLRPAHLVRACTPAISLLTEPTVSVGTSGVALPPFHQLRQRQLGQLLRSPPRDLLQRLPELDCVPLPDLSDRDVTMQLLPEVEGSAHSPLRWCWRECLPSSSLRRHPSVSGALGPSDCLHPRGRLLVRYQRCLDG